MISHPNWGPPKGETREEALVRREIRTSHAWKEYDSTAHRAELHPDEDYPASTTTGRHICSRCGALSTKRSVESVPYSRLPGSCDELLISAVMRS